MQLHARGSPAPQRVSYPKYGLGGAHFPGWDSSPRSTGAPLSRQQIHPLIDLCNAISLAFAIPVAVFDVAEITGYIEVRYADGDESYRTFSGGIEKPDAHEVIFADSARRAHARRWTNRQSSYSAVRDTTTASLIVAEAMHSSAPTDVKNLIAAIAGELTVIWSVTPKTMILSQSSPRFEFAE